MSPLKHDAPSTDSRLWFALAATLLFIPAAITCYFQYRSFATLTLEAPDCLWKDGRPIANDFIQFAAVAEAWQLGRIGEIYASLDKQKAFMGRAVRMRTPYPHILSFNYPPFACWLLRPLAPLDYRLRFVGWILIQFAFALVALWCWRRELGPPTFGIVALGWFASPPVCNTFILGHASFMALGIVSATLYLLNRRRDFAAGLVLSLLLYKPPLGVVFGPLLLLAGRWKTVIGVLVGAAGLAAASLAVSERACRDYPNMGRELYKLVSEQADFFTKHFNLLAFVATYWGLRPVDFTGAHSAMVVVPCVVLMALTAKAWCFPWRPGTPEWCAGASAAVLTTLVATPYLYSYDTMLAAVAAVYSIKTWALRPEWHRWFILGCIGVSGYFVSGDITLMEDMQMMFGVRLQLAPLAFAAWAVLDAWWAVQGAGLFDSK